MRKGGISQLLRRSQQRESGNLRAESGTFSHLKVRKGGISQLLRRSSSARSGNLRAESGTFSHLKVLFDFIRHLTLTTTFTPTLSTTLTSTLTSSRNFDADSNSWPHLGSFHCQAPVISASAFSRQAIDRPGHFSQSHRKPSQAPESILKLFRGHFKAFFGPGQDS